MKSIKWKKMQQTWRDMRYRCLDPKCHAYKSYGKRGITICDRWLDPEQIPNVRTGRFTNKGFLNFYNDMEKSWFPGATIDRIDNDGNYCLENCQWISRSENSSKMVISEGFKTMMHERMKGNKHGFKFGKDNTHAANRRGSRHINNGIVGKMVLIEELPLWLERGWIEGRIEVICEHCGKSCSVGLHNRWHGDNCKMKVR